ncbi:MAG: transketolase [candidate division KSB1 bacterium]|nr:transketolase [candidate division KSB1 bacterium]
MNAPVQKIEELEKTANTIRTHLVKMIAKSGTGHAGGSSSITEIVTVLYFHEMNVKKGNPDYPERDRFVLSKGHACPAQYAAFAELDYIPKDMLWTLHHINSPLQMHPELGFCPGIEMSTGALGQGLSAGIGMALGLRKQKKNSRVYVVIGDGESMEGQIWEAAMSAPKFKLDNLCAVLDYNKFSLSDRVQNVMPLEPLRDKWQAFGWYVLEVNGHSIAQLVNAFDQARQIKGKPVIIIAHTVKGFRITHVEDQAQSHSVSFTKDQVKSTLQHFGCSQQEIDETIAIMEGVK